MAATLGVLRRSRALRPPMAASWSMTTMTSCVRASAMCSPSPAGTRRRMGSRTGRISWHARAMTIQRAGASSIRTAMPPTNCASGPTHSARRRCIPPIIPEDTTTLASRTIARARQLVTNIQTGPTGRSFSATTHSMPSTMVRSWKARSVDSRSNSRLRTTTPPIMIFSSSAAWSSARVRSTALWTRRVTRRAFAAATGSRRNTIQRARRPMPL